MKLSGESLAVDANGRILAKADDTEQLMYIEIDVKETSHIRARKKLHAIKKNRII